MRSRDLAVPLAAYVLVTVVLPLANGAASRGGFVHHTALVLVGCAAVAAVVVLVNKLRPRSVGDRT